ncbi:DMT family transporter [Schaedlerella arabinosiphila]|uniref:DMT family transporter n=1 Tax=Schaedlerella arabinosiphila TaxID=2044587 RepID=A0A9X5CAP6_9FIRM|nr:DMT family transporter [Schaedlerella arabinosiphila]NDO70783.1 DMT family transporter [Schaedlerella arabinosiphila]
MKEKKKAIAVIYILLSALFFSLMNMFVRLSGDLPSVQKSFFRNLVSLAFAAAILKREGAWFSGKRENIRYLLLRSGAGTLGILCNFYAVDHLVLADASMLNKMSPFFAIVFSYLILKEKIRLPQALIVGCAFAGSLLIIKPTEAVFHSPAALIGLLGGLGAGIAYTYVRVLGTKGEKGPFVVFVFSAFSCAVTLPYLLLYFQPMSRGKLLSLLLAGLSAAGGQFSITAAYFHAPAKEISVYDYSQILFSAVLGFFVFGQIPDALSWIGYGIICSMAVAMFLYNRKRTL